MSSDKYVDVYVCCARNENGGAVQRTVCDKRPTIQRQGDAIILNVQPAGSSAVGDVLATVELIPRDATQYCDMPDPELAIGQAAMKELGAGDNMIRLPYVLLQFRNPDDCRWRLSRAVKHGYDASAGPLGIAVGSSYQPSTQGGDVESEVLIPGAGALVRSSLMKIALAPGEYVEPVTTVYDGEEYSLVAGAGGHFATACLAGGRVIDVDGSYGTEDVAYHIGVIGVSGRLERTCLCTPSDFAEWRIGDWVMVATAINDCDAPAMEPLDIADDDSSGTLTLLDLQGGIVVPLGCGKYTAKETPYEPLPLPGVTTSPMGDLLALCLRTGMVITINDSGSVDVEMPWGPEYGVPVHYHCSGASTVAGGHTAFQPGDSVLVVSTRKQNAAHAIIGFSDGQPRSCSEYIVISTGIPEHGGQDFYLVWDAVAGRPARDLPDGKGGVISPTAFPCTREVIEFWLSNSRSVSIEDQMDNLYAAERIGWMDTTHSWSSAWPSEGRMCAELECIPPNECPWWNIYVDGERLGGHCGYCQDSISSTNPHQGTDQASVSKQTTYQMNNEESFIHVLQQWEEEHPFIQCDRDNSISRPAYSVRCEWGTFSDVIQVSRKYNARKEILFSSDFFENDILFSESVNDKVTFPGSGQGTTVEWTDTSSARRPASTENDDNDRQWTCNGRTVTVNGFGLRTHRSWLFAYVLITKRYWIEPYVDPTKRNLHPGFDVVVFAGSGSVLDDPLTGSPFLLPNDAGLEIALASLIKAAFDDATWDKASHAENTYRWEVRS